MCKRYTTAFWLVIGGCAIAGDTMFSIILAGAMIIAACVCVARKESK